MHQSDNEILPCGDTENEKRAVFRFFRAAFLKTANLATQFMTVVSEEQIMQFDRCNDQPKSLYPICLLVCLQSINGKSSSLQFGIIHWVNNSLPSNLALSSNILIRHSADICGFIGRITNLH